MSIEGGKKLSCTIAKAISELPYRYSPMKRDLSTFNSVNVNFGDSFSIEYEPGKSINNKADIDKWLTERYALFQDSGNFINEYEIHHLKWPVNKLNIISLKVNYPRFSKLIGSEPDQIHYSKGIQVVSWDKNKIPL